MGELKLSRRDVLGLAAAGSLAAQVGAKAANSDDYPARDLRLIVPYAAGAGTDAVTRLVARHLASRLGRAVVVENRVGANGNIGTNAVAKAAPDGYTLGTATPGPVAVGRSLYPALPYEPLRDLSPVALFNSSPVVLLVNPQRPDRSVADLVARARAAPDSINAAIAANGSINHLVTELFKVEAGAPLKNIPYAGGAQAITDTIAGHVDLIFISLSSVVGTIASGDLRPLAVAAPVRASRAPDVPTMGEVGLAGVIGSQWNGLVVPAGTPRPVVERLNREISAILALPEVARYFDEQGMNPEGGSPEAFGAFLKAESDRWADIVKRANVHVE